MIENATYFYKLVITPKAIALAALQNVDIESPDIEIHPPKEDRDSYCVYFEIPTFVTQKEAENAQFFLDSNNNTGKICASCQNSIVLTELCQAKDKYYHRICCGLHSDFGQEDLSEFIEKGKY